MALNSVTVSQLRRILDGLPDDQKVLVLDQDGLAQEVTEILPETITDKGTGQQVLLLEFAAGETFGFEPHPTEQDQHLPVIDSEEE